MTSAYNVREIAQQLQIAEQTVRKLVKDGVIPSIRVSPRRTIIPAKAFERWLDEKRETHVDHD